jgi:hypothetical protein
MSSLLLYLSIPTLAFNTEAFKALKNKTKQKPVVPTPSYF